MDVGMKNDLNRLISEFANGCEDSVPLRFARGRAIYRSLIRPLQFPRDRREERERLRAHRRPENRKEVFQNDPLAGVFGGGGTPETSPETIFIEKSLRFMEETLKMMETLLGCSGSSFAFVVCSIVTWCKDR